MYGNDNSSVIIPDYLLTGNSDSNNDNSSGITQCEEGNESSTSQISSEDDYSGNEFTSLDVNDVPNNDYSEYLVEINDNLIMLTETQVDYTEQLQLISDNCFRLYYFIGGLYVVFFVILAIKFFKQFF